MADPNALRPTLKSIKAQLLAKELRLPKTTAGGGGKGKNNDKNKDKYKNVNGTACDKCTYEPCGKWGHKEVDC